jgi:hypothetical protein
MRPYLGIIFSLLTMKDGLSRIMVGKLLSGEPLKLSRAPDQVVWPPCRLCQDKDLSRFWGIIDEQ